MVPFLQNSKVVDTALLLSGNGSHILKTGMDTYGDHGPVPPQGLSSPS